MASNDIKHIPSSRTVGYGFEVYINVITTTKGDTDMLVLLTGGTQEVP
jgi:hypothetical protein